ncbi:hypothetical protein AB691_3347 [Stutzerimonas stutzeri]|nr:hypothetical protein AB691_3347 [Stutzerimonas stutzeri]
MFAELEQPVQPAGAVRCKGAAWGLRLMLSTGLSSSFLLSITRSTTLPRAGDGVPFVLLVDRKVRKGCPDYAFVYKNCKH